MSAPTPPALSLDIGENIAGIIAAAATAYQQERELQTRVTCARHLAYCVGPVLGIPEGEVWEALTFIPDNLLFLLDSPQGWSRLSAMVAQDLGVCAMPFTPCIH